MIESNPISQLRQSISKAVANKVAPSGSFSEAITSATQNLITRAEKDSSVAMATAELLQLQMMKSALSLGDDAKTSSSSLDLPVKLTLSDLITKRQNTDSIPSSTPTAQNTPLVESPSQRPEGNIQEVITRASEKYGVDGALIKAVIKAESNFNPSALSRAGAQGLMQLMPSTARGLGVVDSYNPEQNVMAGTRFLKDMLNRYHGNLDSALAAYNWGPGNVDRKGTSSLPQETREYLAKVKTFYNQYIG
jgi:soluble lytic murein transglycosylase-like protein